MARNPPRLLFVVPCYNEEAVLENTARELQGKLEELIASCLCSPEGSGILFVDDGSKDSTWRHIAELSLHSDRIAGLRLSRNKGHQAALIAGLECAFERADASITIDADLQDDLAVSGDMLKLYAEGYDIVFGVRSDRGSDNFTKRLYANLFYSLMLFLGVEIIPGHADFRLMSRQAMGELLRYEERSLFLRGVLPQLGYKTASVYYARKKREAGSSKYPFRKSLSLAVDGIVSFSNKPLRIIAYAGLILGAASVVGIFLTLLEFIRGGAVEGWSSIMVVVTFIGGAQLFGIGIIGEYIGRIYKEVKRRPRFHISECTETLVKSK